MHFLPVHVPVFVSVSVTAATRPLFMRTSSDYSAAHVHVCVLVCMQQRRSLAVFGVLVFVTFAFGFVTAGFFLTWTLCASCGKTMRKKELKTGFCSVLFDGFLVSFCFSFLQLKTQSNQVIKVANGLKEISKHQRQLLIENKLMKLIKEKN